MKRIFISHSSLDEKIGEQLLDALIELGISKDEVFYSSNFHTGVGLGKNFPLEVKTGLQQAELIIFVLTKNFYRSPYCLNEMGAAWAFDKPFIPILLDGLEYSDMKGFIDGHYIAIKPNPNELYKVFSHLKNNFNSIKIDVDVEEIFKNFITSANIYISKIEKEYVDPLANISNTEKMILNNRYTENEILLFGYFIEKQTNILNDSTEYDFENKGFIESADFKAINEYSNIFNDFNYKAAQNLLEQSNLLVKKYEFINGIEEYIGCVLYIDIFRDLISLSEVGKEKIESIKDKNRKANIENFTIKEGFSVQNNSETKEINQNNNEIYNELESFILSSKITEVDALMLKYLLDTSTYILGDRWKADGQISHIRMWEKDNDLNSMLSRNYDAALRKLQFKNYVGVHSETSYGNPREWILKEPYKSHLIMLNKKVEKVLKETLSKNKYLEEPLPF